MEMKRIPLVFAGTLERTFEPATTVDIQYQDIKVLVWERGFWEGGVVS
jgi:hypothetical protein